MSLNYKSFTSQDSQTSAVKKIDSTKPRSYKKNPIVVQQESNKSHDPVSRQPTNIGEIKRALLQGLQTFGDRVKFAYLFGSKARGDEHGHAGDIDLAVYVNDPNSFSFQDKLALQSSCCRALKRDDIDLVVLNQTRNIVLLEQIVREGVLIFEKNRSKREDFELDILHRFLDFKHQRAREMGS